MNKEQEKNQNISRFPLIQKETIINLLCQFSSGPSSEGLFVGRTFKEMEKNQPNLREFWDGVVEVGLFWEKEGKNLGMADFILGSCFMTKALQEEAKNQGIFLPKITKKVIEKTLEDFRGVLKKTQDLREELGIPNRKELSQTNPHLLNLLDSQINIPGRETFCNGILTTLILFLRQQTVEALKSVRIDQEAF